MTATLPYFEITGPEGENFRIEIKTERATIGRLEEWNDVSLSPDPQQLISRKAHASIEYQQGWWLIDNGSVNRTFIRHERNQPLEVVQGRIPLHDGETVCILGQLLDDGGQRYWELVFHDPAITRPAGPLDVPASTAYLEYDWSLAKLYRIEHGHRQELGPLRPQEHKLVRYMAQRNRSNDGEPVLCTFEELLTAVWDENATSDTDLTHLVWQLRKKIERDYHKPQFLEIVRGLGYRLWLRPLE
jgi:DNA-binding winged helix-turn-helix (wHTH) protein